MSNSCGNYVEGESAVKEPIDFCYGHDDFCYYEGVKMPFHVSYAKGILPIDDLTEEFIKKVTLQDEYAMNEDSGKPWRILGHVEDLTLKYELPAPEGYRELYIEMGFPDPGPILTIENPTFYDIMKENGNWRINIIGPDESRVRQAAKRINNRLSAI